MKLRKIEENRMYIDLIHGRKFNKGQRESIRNAIASGLNMTVLKQLVSENYSSQHINEFVRFFKNAKYKDNKTLYAMFRNPDTEVAVLNEINKGLEDGMDELHILLYAQPAVYRADQMEELRLFLKQDSYTDEYYGYIFDREKPAESMKAIRSACMMEIPFEEISSFDCYSKLYPAMIHALTEGILPQEVHMILEVTDEPNEFNTIVKGISLGLDDEEIKAFLMPDMKHLEFHLDLMGEVHDTGFVKKVANISELDRRELVEGFESEKNFEDYLLHLYGFSKMDKDEQIDVFLNEAGKIKESRLLESGYLESYIDGALHDEKRLRKLALNGYLLDEISEAYHIDQFHLDRVSFHQILEDVCMEKYATLISQRETMTYFLNHSFNILELMNENLQTITKGDGILTFDINENFKVFLKEYKDFYDIDKVTVMYGKDNGQICEVSASQLEKMAKESRKIRLDRDDEISNRLKEGRGI